MPPIANNTTETRPEDGDEADWARWEQTFRDARPVLPEAAMARIEASVRAASMRAAEMQAATPNPSRKWMAVLLLIVVLPLLTLRVLWPMLNDGSFGRKTPLAGPASTPTPTPAPSLVEDRFTIDVVIGPPLLAPDAPLIPLDDYPQWTAGLRNLPLKPKPVAIAPTARNLAMLHAAEHVPLDGHHALAVLEMCRALNISAPVPVAFPPDVSEFRIGACWRMLPLRPEVMPEFNQQLDRLRQEDPPASFDQRFWIGELGNILFEYNHVMVGGMPGAQGPPLDFPSRAADKARFDALTELGLTNAQAALDVLSTRSYVPLSSLSTVNPQSPLRQDWVPCSNALIERLFALRQAHHDGEAEDLVAATRKIPYLTSPQDLAILMARLGSLAAWEKLLQPLMNDEVGFVEHPPAFDQLQRATGDVAIIQAGTKATNEGVTKYTAAPRLSAGPWRLTCDRITAYHSTDGSVLLTGTGNVITKGVINLYSATADEMTFNTKTGDLKLAGHVHLDGWDQATDAASCTISRTDEVRDVAARN